MVDHTKFFSAKAKKRQEPYLVKMRPSSTSSSIDLNLASGLPDPELFPFKEATVTLKSGEVLHLPQSLMHVALQYTLTTGIPQLMQQVRDMTVKVFAPPHMTERGQVLTAGGNCGIYCILHTFLDPGDHVFLPECTYPTFLSALKTTEAKAVPIPSDRDGLRPDLLRAALGRTPAARRKLLYLVPNGDNPTGTTLSEERRQAIYNLACEHDFLIVEDDPYYFMQYGTETPPSFLSLDSEGRVLRIDTFTKTVGPGLRLGYVTADKPFTDKIETLLPPIMGHAPVLSQVVLSEMLHTWGLEGYLQHTRQVAHTYRKKRDVMLQAATKHLSGLCEWKEGDGMFLWLKVLGLEDVREILERKCVERHLFLVPGSACMWDQTKPSPYIRVSYSLATPEIMDKALRILADVIKEELEKVSGQTPQHRGKWIHPLSNQPTH